MTLSVPEPVAAEFYAAAEQLNQRFPGASPRIDAKALTAFSLARHECQDICAQFDLALRLVEGTPGPPFNPVLQQDLGRDSRPVPTQPASEEAA